MKITIKSIFNKYNAALLTLLLLSIILRFINIDYSDFQGDEIKALYLPDQGQTFWQFLLVQRKGPIQILITFVIKLIDPLYNSQLLVRLPFFVAGVLSIYFFYKLICKHFGNRIAFYSSFFLVTNGFFVAFSRIVQYQSLVILFSILTLYFFSFPNKKNIALGFLFWALGILSHYDTIFIMPFALYLLYKWVYQEGKLEKDRLLALLVSGLGAVLLVCLFYVPFLLNLSDTTVSYWQGRITGEISGKISSSKYLFLVYQPILVLKIYLILFFSGSILTLFTFLKIKTNLFLIENKASLLAIVIWFFLGFIFMEKFVYIPGTHIYVYLLPMFIFLGFGIYFMENIVKLLLGDKVGIPFFVICCTVVFAFIFAQSYVIYVDNSKEYPWEQKKFFIWTLPIPNSSYHLSLFGFPYYRNWEGIRDFVMNLSEPTINAYSCNERRTISRYYVNLDKSVDRAGVYIHIKNPQSYDQESKEEKAVYWASKYDPIFTLTRGSDEIVSIYLMPPGSYEEIKKMGY